MNERFLIDYEPTLIRFGSDILKIATMLVFFGTAFTAVFFLENRVNFSRPELAFNTLYPLVPHIF